MAGVSGIECFRKIRKVVHKFRQDICTGVIKTRNHKARTVIDFISDMVAAERAFGHTVMIVRMDRAPEHESDELRSGMRALGVVLELTPRG